ncbi:unnamed protein product [Urochloa humidicola]
MAAEPDRLSSLPDDLLRRILRFAPAREAASTAVLSRRWRRVWPTTPSPAVILDTRLYDRAHHGGGGGADSFWHDRCDIDREAFFLDAEAALAAHADSGGIRCLAIHIEADGPEAIQSFMSQYQRYHWESHYIASDVLGHPACAAVEVLTVKGEISFGSIAMTARRRAAFRKQEQSTVANNHVGYYKLSLGSLPFAALRVLHIAGCKNLMPSPADGVGFPCLEEVRLQHCAVSLCTLQDMIVASPRLAALLLESVYIKSKVCRPTLLNDGEYGGDGGSGGYMRYNDHCCYNNNDDEDRDDDGGRNRVERLCCPGVTSLVLANCSCKGSLKIELDTPRLRRFRYSGYIDRFVLKSPPLPDVQRADLHFLDDASYGQDARTCERFWLFVKNFCNTKSLKLKLDFVMGDIAVVAENKRHEKELLGETLFVNLEELEVDGQYKPGREGVAVAIGNLLQCCPVLRDLKLKLNTVDRNFRRRGHTTDRSGRLYKSTFLDRKSKLDTRKSTKHFAHRRHLEFYLGEGDGDDDDHDQCEVSDLPGLSDKWFDLNCLRGSLRRVSLQFRKDKQSSGFGIQLIKFFLERAMVLEEMYIDDGNRKMCEHMNRKVFVGGCTASASHPCSEYQVSAGTSQLFGENQFNSKKEERRTNRWSTSFKIIPLER